MKCPNCMGVGYFGQSTDCRRCGGTGQLKEIQLTEEEKEYFSREQRHLLNGELDAVLTTSANERINRG